jgi:hypothetical protein
MKQQMVAVAPLADQIVHRFVSLRPVDRLSQTLDDKDILSLFDKSVGKMR